MTDVVTWQPTTRIDAACVYIARSLQRLGHAPMYLVLGGFLVFWLRPWWPHLDTPLGWQTMAWCVMPVLALTLGLRIIDHGRREPVLQLVDAFLAGLLVAAVAAMVNHFIDIGGPWFFLLVVGPVEETAKLSALAISSLRQRSFDEPDDGILYGMAVGAGFAAIENITYLAIAPDTTTLLSRLCITTPAHMAWSGFAGYHMGLCKWSPHRGPLMVKGLGIAALLHGLFDIAVGQGRLGVMLGAASIVALLAWLMTRIGAPSDQRQPRSTSQE